MMVRLLVLLLIGLVFEAVGVVLLKQGLEQAGEIKQVQITEIIRVIKAGATNPRLQLGVLFEAVFFGCLLVLMSKGGDVSFVWPLTAMGFVLTTLAARFYLREEISLARWTGVLLIMIGAAFVIYSEKTKSGPAASPAASQPAVGPK
jgi:uncharacterized membrane protein